MGGAIRVVLAGLAGLVIGGGVVGWYLASVSPGGVALELLTELAEERRVYTAWRAGEDLLAGRADLAEAQWRAAEAEAAAATAAAEATAAPVAEARLAAAALGLPAVGVAVPAVTGRWTALEALRAYEAVAAERDALAVRVGALEGALDAERTLTGRLREALALEVERRVWAVDTVEALAGARLAVGPGATAGAVCSVGALFGRGGSCSAGVAMGLSVSWAW